MVSKAQNNGLAPAHAGGWLKWIVGAFSYRGVSSGDTQKLEELVRMVMVLRF